MKTTRYFELTRRRRDRTGIEDAWIQRVIDKPERELRQRDGRIRRWARLDEVGGRYLRVALLADGLLCALTLEHESASGYPVIVG